MHKDDEFEEFTYEELDERRREFNALVDEIHNGVTGLIDLIEDFEPVLARYRKRIEAKLREKKKKK